MKKKQLYYVVHDASKTYIGRPFESPNIDLSQFKIPSFTGIKNDELRVHKEILAKNGQDPLLSDYNIMPEM
jgi:hypothetical protein